MSFSFESTRVQKPLSQPTTSNAGSTYRFAHRRQNTDGQHSLWTEGPTTNLPADLTPESYGDTYLKDEFVMSDDDGVTWRIVTSTASHTGALTVASFDSGWPVTSDSNNQQSYINSAALGSFSASENPSRDFYLVNLGQSASTLGFNIIDTVTELVATQYSNQVQLAITGIFFPSGNGNPNTTFNTTKIWQTPPQSLNAFKVSLPTNAYIRFTLTLTNFPQGGIQSSSVDFGLEFVPNPTKFAIGLDHVWLKGSRIIDDQAGFGAELISTSSADNIDIAPFALNIDGSAYYQASTLTIFSSPTSLTNFRLQATAENITSVVESSEALPTNAISLATFDWDGTAISNVINVAPIRTVDYGKLEDASIARGRFITVNSSGEPSLATEAASAIGVSLFTDSGYYTRSGLVWLESSASINVGNFLVPDSTGRAAVSTLGPAIALSSATAAGEFILADFRAASGGTGSGGGGAITLGGLNDVDTSTTPPTDGQALVYDLANNQWVPGSVASSGGSGGSSNSLTKTLLAEMDLTGQSSVDLTGIVQSHDRLFLVFEEAITSNSVTRDTINIFFNDDLTNTNYHRQFLAYSNGAASALSEGDDTQWILLPGATSQDTDCIAELQIEKYAGTRYKSIKSNLAISSSTSESYIGLASGGWDNTAPITKITASIPTGTFTRGTIKLYGESTSSGGSSGGSGALEYLSTVTTIGGETDITFSGLSGSDNYLVKAVFNVAPSDSYLLMYVNGDTTNSNYSCQQIFATSGNPGGSQQSLPRVAFVDEASAGAFANIEVQRLPMSDTIVFQSQQVYDDTNGSSSGRTAVIHDAAGDTDITELQFVPVTGSFVANCVFHLYKHNVV